jgi:hypothetical protein
LAVYFSGCATFRTSARLTVSTTPEGATATADAGVRDCITPCLLELESDSDHAITFRKEGYQDASVALVSVGSGWFLRDVALRPVALSESTHPEAYSLSEDRIEVMLAPLPTVSAFFPLSQTDAESPQLEDIRKDQNGRTEVMPQQRYINQVQQYVNHQSSASRAREQRFPLLGLLPSIKFGGSGALGF